MDFTLSLGPTYVDFPIENDKQQPIDVDTPEEINWLGLHAHILIMFDTVKCLLAKSQNSSFWKSDAIWNLS